MKPVSELSREAKVMIYVIGLMAELKAAGLVEGGRDLSEKGSAAYVELRATGFEPNAEELKNCVRFLCHRSKAASEAKS